MSIHFKRGNFNITVETFQNLNLLAHAQMEELDIGSQCGGHGICGRDRILISRDQTTSLSSLTENEKKHLTLSQLKNGYRLACQCWPNSDGLEIDVTLP